MTTKFEEEKKTAKKIGSIRKALNTSAKFRNSFAMKGCRRSTKTTSDGAIEDIRDAREAKAVDAFRQLLILEELLPSKQDDYHMILRYCILF